MDHRAPSMFTEVPAELAGVGPMRSPFDEPPRHPAALWAVQDLRQRLEVAEDLAPDLPVAALDGPRGGTMLAVLVVRGPTQGGLRYLRAFAGSVEGRALLPGWAPPLYDVSAYDDARAVGEALLARLAARTEVEDPEGARRAVEAELQDQLVALERRRLDLAARLRRGKAARAATRVDAPPEVRAELDDQSRFDNARAAEQRRAIAAEQATLEAAAARARRRAAAWSRLRIVLSERLLAALQAVYAIPGPGGEAATLADVFAPARAPGGAGDCAGAKLVGFARAHDLEPVALAETWWGAPPPGGGRVDGALYPACRAKCGPLMGFMLSDLDVAPPVHAEPSAPRDALEILHEDEDLLVVNKPAGLLSVPGRRKQDSVQLRLQDTHPEARAVHRLDQDASGVLVLAKSLPALRWAQAEFSARRVDKRYVAVLEGEVTGDEGEIELAFRLDPDDRPRQVYDPERGKLGFTRWRVTSRAEGRTRVELEPVTGRTHQLRCHCAHPRGLGAPIVGDRLYGRPAERLLLHAARVVLSTPAGVTFTFAAPPPF